MLCVILLKKVVCGHLHGKLTFIFYFFIRQGCYNVVYDFVVVLENLEQVELHSIFCCCFTLLVFMQ